MSTIKQHIAQITRGKKLDKRTGMLYSSKRQLTAHYNCIRMFALFASDESTFLVRPHVFRSSELRTPAEWDQYLSDNYDEILPRILSGMNLRTQKFWRVSRIIGWVPYVEPKRSNSKAHTSRNKTKRTRR